MSETSELKNPTKNAAVHSSVHDEDSRSEESWQSVTHLKKWCP